MGALNVIALPGEGPIELALQPSAAWAGYGAVLMAATALLSGIAPALRTSKRSLTATLQDGGGHAVTERLWMRHLFVVGQVAVSLILLTFSSLLLRSLARVATMDPGFDVDRGLVARVQVDAGRYARDGGLALAAQLVERLEQLPGVASASFANIVPLGTDRSATILRVDGLGQNEGGPRTYVNSVAPRYFATLGIPLVRGRDFGSADRAGAATGGDRDRIVRARIFRRPLGTWTTRARDGRRAVFRDRGRGARSHVRVVRRRRDSDLLHAVRATPAGVQPDSPGHPQRSNDGGPCSFGA